MAKVTVVSCVPRAINENMPHIVPSNYSIPKVEKLGDFNLLVIDNAKDFVYQGEGNHIERVVFAEDVAKNLIRMVSGSQLSTGPEAFPGLFIVSKEVTNKQIIRDEYKEQLEQALEKQRRWFGNLVNDADDIWNRFRNLRMISELQRDACNHLNLKREWNVSIKFEDDPNALLCPACGANLPHKEVTICGVCRVIIKPEEHTKRFGPKAATAGVK